MGNWKITITGVGAHHNPNNPTDADRIARQVVRVLTASGQAVNAAFFFHGAGNEREDLLAEGGRDPETLRALLGFVK